MAQNLRENLPLGATLCHAQNTSRVDFLSPYVVWMSWDRASVGSAWGVKTARAHSDPSMPSFRLAEQAAICDRPRGQFERRLTPAPSSALRPYSVPIPDSRLPGSCGLPVAGID